jgi:hypothetical protein
VRPQRLECRLFVSGCDQEQHLPLVGHQQRVQPNDLADPLDQLGNRDGRFVEQDAGTGCLQVTGSD